MSEVILLTADRHEVGVANVNIDFEVGTGKASNDWESTVRSQDIYGLYIPHTEFGGMVEYRSEQTDSGYVTYRGYTWRGLLSRWVLMPPTGSDYRVVSGDANDIIRSILADTLGGMFYVPETASGLTLTTYQFPLYCTVHDGLEQMLESNGYRLYIHAEKVAAATPVRVYVEAVKSTQVSGTFNEDSRLLLTYTENRMGINHLICGGKGDLQERLIVHLYADKDGNISQTQTITGEGERQAFYDYPNAQSEQDLIDKGTVKLKALMSSKSLSIASGTTENLEIGDTARGTFPDGSVVVKPITKKILTVKNGTETVEHYIDKS